MAYLWHRWGLSNKMETYAGKPNIPIFTSLDANGYSGAPDSASSTITDGRVEILPVGGHKAIKLTRLVGDALAAGGHRTELIPLDVSHIADWATEGVSGAVAAKAFRKYRWRWMVPPQDLSHLHNGDGTFFVVWQLHQTSDTSPADTQGLEPTLAGQIRRQVDGSLIYAIVQNHEPNATCTVDDPSTQSVVLYTWPFRFGRWEDIVVDVQWSYTTLGFLKIRRNGRLVVSNTTGNCPNDSLDRGGSGSFPKFGPYIGQDAEASAYYSGCIVMDQQSTLRQVYSEVANPFRRSLWRHPVGRVWSQYGIRAS